jgi:hypothetical protein
MIHAQLQLNLHLIEHPGTVLQINRIPYLPLAPLLQVFPKGRKLRETAEVILLKDHKMSDRPPQALEYKIIKDKFQSQLIDVLFPDIRMVKV